MGKGYYGPDYIKVNGDYSYQAQVDRLHNLRQWDRDETMPIASKSVLSLEELKERFFFEQGVPSNEDAIINKITSSQEKKKRHEDYKLKYLYRYESTTEIDFSFLKKYTGE